MASYMMKNAPWQTHLFYIALLAIGIFYFKKNGSTVSEAAWRQVFQSQKNIAERERLAADAIFNEIKLKHERTPSGAEKLIDSLAVTTQNELDELAQTLQNASNFLLSSSSLRASSDFWQHHASSLVRQIQRAKQDFPARVPQSDISFDFLLGIENEQVALENTLKNASSDELLLYLHAQQANVEMLRNAMMQKFYGMTKNMGQWGYQLKIVMDAPKLTAQKDKPWEARFYLCPSGTNAQNLTFEVAGKPIPHQTNGVYFQTQFQQTGEQKLPVRAVVRQPNTGELKIYEAEFLVPVF